MNEQEFQLELERFKQKASWETHLFYFVLSSLWGIILLGISKNIVIAQNLSESVEIEIFGLHIWGWFLILTGVLIVGEWTIQGEAFGRGYLNFQKEILRKKIIGKDTKIYNEEKLRDLVVLEKRKSKIENKILKKKTKNEKLDKKRKELDSKIDKLKKELFEETGNKKEIMPKKEENKESVSAQKNIEKIIKKQGANK